ncbi:c-type cytochrome [Pontibacter akesuensis]|nr:cytochrome c [Pontibacter akesuensis]
MESYLAADIDPVLLLEVEGGKRLFDTNCSPCHDMTSVVVGPPLAGIIERRDSAWVYSFIKNSQKMVEAGDSTAVQLYNEFSKMQMPAFDFTDEQIDSIVSYISLYPNRP